jgi:hypothetical protein
MSKVEVFEVEQGLPIPAKSARTVGMVPIGQLEPGESMAFDVGLRSRVASYASQLKKRKGLEFTVRLVEPNVCRVWRTK